MSAFGGKADIALFLEASIVAPCQKLTNMTPSAKAPPAANR